MQGQTAQETKDACVSMPVERLSIGMFVAELDRPWSESPFLIEGFRIDTADELATLVRLCRHVVVDTSRSAGSERTAPDVMHADGVGRTYAFKDAAVAAALDRTSVDTRGAGAAATRKEDHPQDLSLLDQPLGWRWIGNVVHDLLKSYLTPRKRTVDDLPAPVIVVTAQRTSADLTPPAEPGFLDRLMREILHRPTPTDAAVRQPARPRQDVAVHADTTGAQEREAGVWARLKTALRELTAKGRTAPADPMGASRFEELKQSSPPGPAADAASRGWPPIGQLLKRALFKLFGLAPPADEASHDGASADDPTQDELAAWELEYERFTREIPNAAQVLQQSMSALHLNYYRAGCDVPLALELLRPWVTQIVESVLRSENALVWLARLESHDQLAHKRGLQAAVYMAQFGAQLGMPHEEIEQIALGGALLDIGKMQVAESILKKPGPLDAAEREQVQAHVDLAMSMMDASGINDVRVRETVERHHEREDGSGYPRGLAGEDIGVYGRIAGIVDTFLALTGERPYAPIAPIDKVLRLMLQARGTLFHAPLVEHFIQMIGVYPVGSLVELSNGEVAAVLSHNRVRRLMPRVLVMIAADGVPLPCPTTLDLLSCPRDGVGNVISIVRGLPFGHQGITAQQLFAATVQ